MRYQQNGIWYDSDKSAMVGNFYESGNKLDDTYGYQALHKKRTGKYFLHVKGYVPEYAHVRRHNPYEKLIPISYAEAEEWAKKHMTEEDYMKTFGADLSETLSDDRVQMSLRVSKRKFEIARRNAEKLGMFVTDYVESLLPDKED